VRSRGRREPRALSGVRPHRSRIERSCGVVGAMGIAQRERLLGRRACGRRASASHSSDVRGRIDRTKGAIQRASCGAGMRGRTIGGVFGDERGRGGFGRCHGEGDHGGAGHDVSQRNEWSRVHARRPRSPGDGSRMCAAAHAAAGRRGAVLTISFEFSAHDRAKSMLTIREIRIVLEVHWLSEDVRKINDRVQQP
jgi:hypothetical protein